MAAITIQNRALFPSVSQEVIDPVIRFEHISTTTTIAELIRQTVIEQIAAQQRRAVESLDASDVVDRYRLASKVAPPHTRPRTPDHSTSQEEQDSQVTDEATSTIERAWRAFEQRAYIIVIDGVIARSLEEEVICGDERSITFLRLTPLVGG